MIIFDDRRVQSQPAPRMCCAWIPFNTRSNLGWGART